MELKRCQWPGQDPLYLAYHDEEWGVPLHEDNRLFEMIVLEGMQSGLSWLTILRKREAFRSAFHGFDPLRVSTFDQREIEKLLLNPGIIRNRLKLEATVANARATLRVQEKYGSLDSFLWRTVEGKPVVNRWKGHGEAPAKTPLSETLAKECKKEGFQFIGPTVAYAFMQAIGMVNDHEVTCFRYKELSMATDIRKRAKNK
jgi:DNA-3-methyladenine glycosylase I